MCAEKLIDSKKFVDAIIEDLDLVSKVDEKELNARKQIYYDIFKVLDQETLETLPTTENIEKNINKIVSKSDPSLTEEQKQMQRDLLKKVFIEGKSPAEVMNLTKKNLEFIYSYAYNLYQTGNLDSAIAIFRFLDVLNPTDPRYAFGIGAALHMQKKYVEGADWYIKSAALDPTGPIAYYHASDCYIKANDSKSAQIVLIQAIARCGNNPVYEKLKTKAELMLDQLIG